ncbi:HET-domain-containing protein [Phaeosphaeriaceae sp. SRC1lsM3a]|nr:HET-domain-containing protein [Stagonospora sp. SRC1lsM3a]
MTDYRRVTLCRTCRNINLRIETFLDLGCRYPTSLEYTTLDDVLDPDLHDVARHYVSGECLDGAIDHANEELERKLDTLPLANVFDDYDILISERPTKKKVLGTLEAVTAKSSSCALCALVVNVAHAAPLFCPDDARCELQFHYIGQGNGGIVPSLYERDDETKHGRYNCELLIGAFSTELQPVHSREDLNWFGGRLYEDQVDFSLCKRWLRGCEELHERCGTQSWQRHMKDAPRLRLIDVTAMCLVDANQGDRYVALSYVWGATSTFQTRTTLVKGLYAPGGLQKVWRELSRTVQDAIEAVRCLDERYLWTDAICIIQDDPEDKKELVKDMDIVYARAILTLVAAEGTDADAGLPGVRRKSRPHTVPYDIDNDLALLPSKAISEVLLNCPWSKRAWTFQEGMLSARMLIFTKRTVSFTCCSTTWSEDVKNPNENQGPPWAYAPGTLFDFRSNLSEVQAELSGHANANEQGGGDDDDGGNEEEEEADLLNDLWTDVVGNLSLRNLSFESDILFAAAGLISVVQKIFKIKSIYGLPERRLEQFLFWSPSEPGSLRRRRDMNGIALHPSWSWAGWVGEVSWPEHTARPYGDDKQQIEWFGLSDIASEPIALQCGGRGTVSDDIALASGLHGDIHPVESLDFPILMLDTRTATLCISSTADPPSWISELQVLAWSTAHMTEDNRSGVYCITSLHDASHVVGSVVLDSADLMPGCENAVTTFAIISSSTYQEQQYDGSFALIYHRVLALYQQEGIFARIGHGAVLAKEVRGVAWQKETVLLG